MKTNSFVSPILLITLVSSFALAQTEPTNTSLRQRTEDAKDFSDTVLGAGINGTASALASAALFVSAFRVTNPATIAALAKSDEQIRVYKNQLRNRVPDLAAAEKKLADAKALPSASEIEADKVYLAEVEAKLHAVHGDERLQKTITKFGQGPEAAKTAQAFKDSIAQLKTKLIQLQAETAAPGYFKDRASKIKIAEDELEQVQARVGHDGMLIRSRLRGEISARGYVYRSIIRDYPKKFILKTVGGGAFMYLAGREFWVMHENDTEPRVATIKDFNDAIPSQD